MEDKIKNRIIKLFEPTVKTIEKQINCDHKWKDRTGTAGYHCKKCGYFCDDKILNKLISIQKLIQKGITQEWIKKNNKYIS